MATMAIEFEWTVDSDGYYFAEREPRKAPKGRAAAILDTIEETPEQRMELRRRGGSLKTVRPLDVHPHLFTEFAMLDGTQGGFLWFANRYGFLGQSFWSRKAAERDDYRETLADLLDARDSLRQWTNVLAGDRAALTERFSEGLEVARLDAVMRPVGGHLTMVYQPRSLLSAMRLQLAQQALSGRPIRACEGCGIFFEPPRSDARFCSTNCRTKFHNERRKQAP